MSDIHIEREHQLGFTRAREIAFHWAERLEDQYGMDCTIHEGDDSDTVEFRRAGASGTLEVSGDRFELRADLGLLLSAFKADIQRKVEGALDDLLARERASTPAPVSAGKETGSARSRTARKR